MKCKHEFILISNQKNSEGLDSKGGYENYNFMFYCKFCTLIKSFNQNAYFLNRGEEK